jgi:Ice-binding-like/Bacterial Ig-like domain
MGMCMNIIERRPRYQRLIMAVALCVLAAGCGQDQIFGNVGTAALVPSVTAETPASGAVGVLVTTASISATLNEPVSPITGAASFTLTCAAPCANATGTVSLDATHTIATFTLTAGTLLAPSASYTATIAGATSLASGLAMAAPFSWHFMTVAAATLPDLTRPRVLLTSPPTTTPGPTLAVPSNSSISAIFSKALAPATVSAASFTVACTAPAPCTAPTGTVSYSVSSRTAVFTPSAEFTVGDTYTVTLTTAITDLTGNELGGNQAALPAASDYVWTFTAAAPTAPANVTVFSTNPAANATAVCPTSAINGTFLVPGPAGSRMDPTTVTATTFIVTGPAPASTPVTASSISLDTTTGTIATFVPNAPLTAGVTYTATIVGGANGVKDLAIPANTMAVDFTWSFTVGPATSCSAPAAIPLGSAQPFGTFGGSAGTTNSGILTVINGDIGTTAVSTKVTGFHDTSPGCTYTEVPGGNIGTVNGLIYTAPPPPTVACPDEGTAATAAIAEQARADALTAYNALVAQPAGPDPGAGNLANQTLVAGTYTSASGSFMIQGGDLTLDARGDANAVWVFQMATTLTVGGPGAAAPESVLLINGAQAKNVYWQVGSAATINAGGGGTMVGTIISFAGAAFSTVGNVAVVTLDGRAISLNASVTLVDTVINVPAP